MAQNIPPPKNAYFLSVNPVFFATSSTIDLFILSVKNCSTSALGILFILFDKVVVPQGILKHSATLLSFNR